MLSGTTLLCSILFSRLSVVYSLNCKNDEPCIYLSRDLGWERYVESKGPLPFPIESDSWKRNDTTLFYSISSYRDELCPRTLYNALSKAAHPHRIRIAVVQQNIPGEDIECFEEYCNMMRQHRGLGANECPFADQIVVNKKDARTALGPTWARAIGSTMIGDEEFCMQTDSHMDFVKDWDVKMMEMWSLTNNEYAVLSTYVTAIEELPKFENDGTGVNGRHEVPHLCMVTFNGANGLIRNWGTKCMQMMPKPKMTNIIWGAGLSFSKCHAERKVLYDPFTPHIFDGEEFNKAIRLWTYGYGKLNIYLFNRREKSEITLAYCADIYSPHRVYVVHDYHGSQV